MEPRFPTEITRLIYSYCEWGGGDVFDVEQIRISAVAGTEITPYYDDVDDPFEILDVDFDKNTTYDEAGQESGILDAEKSKHRIISATGKVSSKHNWFLKTVSTIYMRDDVKFSAKADVSNVRVLYSNSMDYVHLFKNINHFVISPYYKSEYGGLCDVFGDKVSMIKMHVRDVSQLRNIPACVHVLNLTLMENADLKKVKIPDFIEELVLEINRPKNSNPVVLKPLRWFGEESKIKCISFEKIHKSVKIILDSAPKYLYKIKTKYNLDIKIPIRELHSKYESVKVIHCETMVFNYINDSKKPAAKLTGITKELYIMGRNPIDLDSIMESNLEILFFNDSEFVDRILKNPPKKLRLFVYFNGKSSKYHFF